MMTTDPNQSSSGRFLNGRPIGVSGTGQPVPAAKAAVLIGSVMVSIPILLGIVVVILANSSAHPDRLAFVAVPFVISAVVGLAAVGVVPLIGYRLQPLPTGLTGTDAERTGLQRFQASMFLRLAFCEIPAIVALGLTFAFPPISLLSYAPGGLISLLLLAVHVRPNRANVARCEAVLDSAGGRSNLSGSFGY